MVAVFNVFWPEKGAFSPWNTMFEPLVHTVRTARLPQTRPSFDASETVAWLQRPPRLPQTAGTRFKNPVFAFVEWDFRLLWFFTFCKDNSKYFFYDFPPSYKVLPSPNILPFAEAGYIRQTVEWGTGVSHLRVGMRYSSVLCKNVTKEQKVV